MIELDTDHDIAKAAAIKVELREYKATCLTRAAKCRREAETASDADMPEWINAARRFEAERSGPQREPPYPAKRHRHQAGMLKKVSSRRLPASIRNTS